MANKLVAVADVWSGCTSLGLSVATTPVASGDIPSLHDFAFFHKKCL